MESIASVEETISDNISKAEIAIDNREMLRLVDMGNGLLDEANRLFEEEDFDGSEKAYEKAKRRFKEAGF